MNDNSTGARALKLVSDNEVLTPFLRVLHPTLT
jgi:hypothetical protein